jgi:hypothetical protein
MRFKVSLAASLLLLAASPGAVAQNSGGGLTPEARQVLFDIVSDPRYPRDQPEKYVEALPKAAALKQSLQANGLVEDINYVYGWSLPADGPLKGRQGNDLIFEVVTRPKYTEAAFLSALRGGAPLLRRLREAGCVGKFNARFKTDLPEAGALSTPQAEKLLYDVVAKPGFDVAKTLAGTCGAGAAADSAPSAAAVTNPAGQSEASQVTRATPDASAPATPGQSGSTNILLLIAFVTGAVCLVGLIVVTILKLAIELKKS